MNTEQNDLTHADVERIVQLVEDAGFGYVHFEFDGLELTLTKEGHQPVSVAAAPVPTTLPATDQAPVGLAPDGTGSSLAAPAPATRQSDPEPDRVPSPSPDGEDGTVTVRSPMIGIFYRAPDPDTPSYVEAGQSVAVGDTLGLVEVMKMYTAVRADVSGTVTEVLADNAAAVEKGQPLVRIQSR